MLKVFTLNIATLFFLIKLVSGSTRFSDVDNEGSIFKHTVEKDTTDISLGLFHVKRETHKEAECTQEGDSCDDGLYCNGEEFCDADLRCISRNPPCIECDTICDEYYPDTCIKIVLDCISHEIFTYAEYDEKICDCVIKPKTPTKLMIDALHELSFIFFNYNWWRK